MKYFRLIDEKNFGTIIKAKGREHYKYKLDINEWVESGIMIRYFSDESDTYDMYEEITEAEAMRIINKQ